MSSSELENDQCSTNDAPKGDDDCKTQTSVEKSGDQMSSCCNHDELNQSHCESRSITTECQDAGNLERGVQLLFKYPKWIDKAPRYNEILLGSDYPSKFKVEIGLTGDGEVAAFRETSKRETDSTLQCYEWDEVGLQLLSECESPEEMIKISEVTHNDPADIIAGDDDPTKISDDPAEIASQELTEIIDDGLTETADEELTEITENDPIEICGDNATEITVEDLAEKTIDEPPGITYEDPTEMIAEESPEITLENLTEIIAKESTKIIAEESTEIIAEESTEIVLEEPHETISDNAVMNYQRESKTNFCFDGTDIIYSHSQPIVFFTKGFPDTKKYDDETVFIKVCRKCILSVRRASRNNNDKNFGNRSCSNRLTKSSLKTSNELERSRFRESGNVPCCSGWTSKKSLTKSTPSTSTSSVRVTSNTEGSDIEETVQNSGVDSCMNVADYIDFPDDFKSACEILNQSLSSNPQSCSQVNTDEVSGEVVLTWFRVAGCKTSFAIIQRFIAYFGQLSPAMLEIMVNSIDEYGNTLMNYALCHNNYAVASVLLETGCCNLDWRNNCGSTSINIAAFCKPKNDDERSVLRKILKMGDIDARSSKGGQTALMSAVSCGNAEMTRLLLEEGANVNIPDDEGSTAIMYAAELGNVECVRLLLSDSKCNLLLEDNDGLKPCQIALNAGHPKVALLIYKRLINEKRTITYDKKK